MPRKLRVEYLEAIYHRGRIGAAGLASGRPGHPAQERSVQVGHSDPYDDGISGISSAYHKVVAPKCWNGGSGVSTVKPCVIA